MTNQYINFCIACSQSSFDTRECCADECVKAPVKYIPAPISRISPGKSTGGSLSAPAGAVQLAITFLTQDKLCFIAILRKSDCRVYRQVFHNMTMA